jgi:hypothetical protein
MNLRITAEKEERYYMSAMPAQNNNPNDIKIRKFRDTLVTGGFAIIAFGIWTVIKIIIEAFTILQPMIGSLSFEGLSQLETEQLQAMIEDGSLFHLLLFTILGFLIVDLIVRIYVGYSARAIGLQKKTRSGKKRSGIVWLIFGIILVSIGIYSLVITLSDTSEILQEHSIIYYVISLFVDVTSLFVTAEVIITGFRFRVLSKKQENIEEVQDAA